jgi:hypothetical protein
MKVVIVTVSKCDTLAETNNTRYASIISCGVSYMLGKMKWDEGSICPMKR